MMNIKIPLHLMKNYWWNNNKIDMVHKKVVVLHVMFSFYFMNIFRYNTNFYQQWKLWCTGIGSMWIDMTGDKDRRIEDEVVGEAETCNWKDVFFVLHDKTPLVMVVDVVCLHACLFVSCCRALHECYVCYDSAIYHLMHRTPHVSYIYYDSTIYNLIPYVLWRGKCDTTKLSYIVEARGSMKNNQDQHVTKVHFLWKNGLGR